MTDYTFCTYFDINFAARGLALYRSLVRRCRQPFTLWALCFDEASREAVAHLDLPGLRLISLAEFEAGDAALLAAKQNRRAIEYYWTCTPSLLLYILRHSPETPLVTYLDADLYFYDDPQAIYDELGNNSILIVGQRYGPEFARRLKRGKYNVGLLAFRRDAPGLDCLNWWRERCIEWCYERVEDGKFADQKYLDDWPERFRSVTVLQHVGANLAPWNWMNYRIEPRGDRALIDGQPLIFYHFHGVKILNGWLYDSGLSGSKPMPSDLLRWFYDPYAAELLDGARQLGGGVADRSLRPRHYNWRVFARALLDGQIRRVKHD